MSRNKYATPKGDRLMGGIFTVQQLRNRYSENGGFLTPRRRRFLRIFIPPYVNPPSGGGLATEFAILIPESKILNKTPQNLYDTIIGQFVEADSAFFAANLWLEDDAFRIDPADIDAELGTEIEGGYLADWDDNQGE